MAIPVRKTDRLWDLTALGLLVIGIVTFVLGRRGLAMLGSGTHEAPIGGTWVSVAELHDAQSRWGLWLAVGGVIVALVSAARHVVRARAIRRNS